MKIFLLGFFLAIVAPCGMVMAMATFDSQVRGVDALVHVLGNQPLAVIPYLFTREEEEKRKQRMIKLTTNASIALGIAVIVIALAINFLYMPLNVLFAKILARLG
jgi:uncharacterized membrane protein